MRRLVLGTIVVCLAGLPIPGWPGSPYAQVAPSGSGARVPGVLPDAATTGADEDEGARIEGRVLAADSGRPLRRAQVRLAAADSREQRISSTDDEGRFAFGSLPAGRYSLRAAKAGYVALAYGQRHGRESGRLITLRDGQRREDTNLSLPAGSVITVRVTDRFGEPFAGASVQIQQFGYTPDGVRTLVSADTVWNRGAVTDDRGETRIYGLMPGDYVLSAAPPQSIAQRDALDGPSDVLERYAPTFYPGTIAASSAIPVSVGVGQEAWAQIPMVSTRLARVSGTVVDSSGRPAAGASIRLASQAAGGRFLVARRDGRGQTSTARDGTFVIEGVPPGDHVLTITSGGRGGRGGREGRGGRGPGGSELATVPVTVSGADVEDLYVVTGPGVTMSGRIRTRGTGQFEPGSGGLRIRLSQVGGSGAGIPGAAQSRTSGVEEDGTFSLDRLSGQVLFDVTAPEGWALSSITIGGRDVTDELVDLTGLTTVSDVVVTITDTVTQVTGRVGDGSGLPAQDGVVVIQPSERLDPVAAARRVRTIRLDEHGQFEATGLRPGRYIATAVETLESGAENSPEVRDRLRRLGEAFTLSEGGSAALALEIEPEP